MVLLCCLGDTVPLDGVLGEEAGRMLHERLVMCEKIRGMAVFLNTVDQASFSFFWG